MANVQSVVEEPALRQAAVWRRIADWREHHSCREHYHYHHHKMQFHRHNNRDWNSLNLWFLAGKYFVQGRNEVGHKHIDAW